MNYSKSYTKAKSFFDQTFSPERQQVIKDFRALNYDVQQEEKNQNIGSSVYSGVSLAGWGLILVGVLGAAFTGGISTSLVAAGLACGGASGGAAVLHQGIKTSILKNKTDSLRKKLRDHEIVCEEMNKHLLDLANDLKRTEEMEFQQTDQDKEMKFLLEQFEAILKHSDTTKTFKTKKGDIYILMSLKTLLEGVPFENSKDKDKFAAVTFVIDLKSLLEDPEIVDYLKKSGECREEWLIDKVLKRYQEEYDDIRKVFKSSYFD